MKLFFRRKPYAPVEVKPYHEGPWFFEEQTGSFLPISCFEKLPIEDQIRIRKQVRPL